MTPGVNAGASHRGRGFDSGRGLAAVDRRVRFLHGEHGAARVARPHVRAGGADGGGEDPRGLQHAGGDAGRPHRGGRDGAHRVLGGRLDGVRRLAHDRGPTDGLRGEAGEGVHESGWGRGDRRGGARGARGRGVRVQRVQPAHRGDTERREHGDDVRVRREREPDHEDGRVGADAVRVQPGQPAGGDRARGWGEQLVRVRRERAPDEEDGLGRDDAGICSTGCRSSRSTRRAGSGRLGTRRAWRGSTRSCRSSTTRGSSGTRRTRWGACTG